MTNYFCPDCTWTPVPAPRVGKDGRCSYCRSQVGQCSRIHARYAPERDELAARLNQLHIF
jgi:hypothetical protein